MRDREWKPARLIDRVVSAERRFGQSISEIQNGENFVYACDGLEGAGDTADAALTALEKAWVERERQRQADELAARTAALSDQVV